MRTPLEIPKGSVAARVPTQRACTPTSGERAVGPPAWHRDPTALLASNPHAERTAELREGGPLAWGTADKRWGFSHALLEVAAFLRQGYSAPGGLFYDEELGGPKPGGNPLREIFPDLDFPDVE